MSATITLHPSVIGRPVIACDWTWDMIGLGYDVWPLELANGALTVEARPPKETARTNANVAKIPRHRRQYGHSALPAGPDLPPDAA